MSARTRKQNAKEKAISRCTHEVLRLEGVISRYHAKLPKLEARLADQKKQLGEAEKV